MCAAHNLNIILHVDNVSFSFPIAILLQILVHGHDLKALHNLDAFSHSC